MHSPILLSHAKTVAFDSDTLFWLIWMGFLHWGELRTAQGALWCIDICASKACLYAWAILAQSAATRFPFSFLARLPNKAWAAFLSSPAFVLLAACAAPFVLPVLIPADAALLDAATYPASSWPTPPGLLHSL